MLRAAILYSAPNGPNLGSGRKNKTQIIKEDDADSPVCVNGKKFGGGHLGAGGGGWTDLHTQQKNSSAGEIHGHKRGESIHSERERAQPKSAGTSSFSVH